MGIKQIFKVYGKKEKALDLDVLNKSSLPKKCFFSRLMKGTGSWQVLQEVLGFIGDGYLH